MPRLERVPLLLIPAALMLFGCKGPQKPEPLATPPLATVRLESLVREHPAYPVLQRLSVAPPGSDAPQEVGAPALQREQKAEALSRPADSKGETSDGARLRLPAGERTVVGIADDARALKDEHERLRRVRRPLASDGSSDARPKLRVPARGAGDATLRRRQLASSLRRETIAACRHVATQRGIALKLPPHVPVEATDMTQRFRTWLREYWQQAQQTAGSSEGVNR